MPIDRFEELRIKRVGDSHKIKKTHKNRSVCVSVFMVLVQVVVFSPKLLANVS